MKFTFVRTLVLAGLGSMAVFSAARAQMITGDPATDGWISQGSSAASNYIDGAGVYNVTSYTTAFTLGASSPLITTQDGFDWNAGDTIVGVGGVFSGANSDLTYSGGADQNGVAHAGATSTRFVVKYGTSSATWAVNSPSGPGMGSLANGGVGSVLLGTYAYQTYPAASGTAFVPGNQSQEQTSVSGTTAINGDVGRVITFWSGTTLVGFESLMDLTLLDAEYPSNGVQLGDDAVLDLQRGSGNFQDSLVVLPQSVPEPTAVWLGGLALLAFGFLRVALRRSPVSLGTRRD